VGVLIAFAVVLLVVCPILALIAALGARSRLNELNELDERLRLLERAVLELGRPAAPAAPSSPAPARTETLRAWEPAPAPSPPPLSPPPAPAPPEPVPAPPRVPAAAPRIPPPPAGGGATHLERSLGARLPVWIGAIALSLAVAFLVKYSFDRGLLSPRVRVGLGAAFGLALLAAGERMRRSAALVAQGLSAAGIAALFAASYAAVELYELVSPSVGFTLLALTTLAGIVLSIRQGLMVAVIGIAGAFLTPALVRSDEPRPEVLFPYLFLVQLAVLASRRSRRGPWLDALSVLCGLVWVLVWALGPFAPGHVPWIGAYLVATAGLQVLTARPAAAGPAAWPVDALALTGSLLVMAYVTSEGGRTTGEWVFTGLLAAGALAVARLRPAVGFVAWVAVGVVLALALSWARDLAPGTEARFFVTVAVLGAVLAGGAWIAHRGATRPLTWGALAAVALVGFWLVAYAGAAVLHRTSGFAGLAFGLAAVAAAGAFPVAVRPALALAAAALVGLGVAVGFEGMWMGIGWAAELALLVELARRPGLAVLRQAAVPLLGLVVARVLFWTGTYTEPQGTLPVLNRFLVGHGLAVLGCAVAALRARRDGAVGLADALEGGAVLLGVALATLEVRHFFHRERLDVGGLELSEGGSYLVVWPALAWGLLRLGRRWPRPAFVWGGAALVVLTVVGCGMLATILNPVFEGSDAGELPVVNRLLWAYGGPALLLGLVAHSVGRDRRPKLSVLAGVCALVMAFLLTTLEVRQAFHGARLDLGPTTNAEKYAYSAAWIAFATVLLVAGIATRSRALRFASLAIMLVTVVKVFLYDLSNLKDLYRVFSFLGLGLSLFLLAWLYQRFVFREKGQEEEEY
jgi:uncharacterized membrane protein